MKINPFEVEEWMNAYETGAKYSIAETCVNSVSIDELFELHVLAAPDIRLY